MYFEGNRNKYISTDVDVALRYKVLRAVKINKASEVEAICKKRSMCKYPKVFQCDNGSEYNSDVTNFLEKQNVKVQRTTFNKELVKLLFKLMDAQKHQELQAR